MGGGEEREQPRRDASCSGGDGSGAAQAVPRSTPSTASASLQVGTAAADGAGAGADDAVRGAQVQMARLLPPSIGAASTSSGAWTEVQAARKFRSTKRPASRPASVHASPVSSAQVGPT